MPPTVFLALSLLLIGAAPVSAASTCLPLDPREPEGNFIVPGTLGDIVYRRVGGRDLALDAYVQKNDARRPLVLVVHGGGWSTGSRVAFVGQFLETLTGAGFNWASIDYRLGPPARAADAVDDLVAAIDFVTCHADALRTDPARIVLLGEDTGAALAVAAAARRPGVRALVLAGGRYAAEGSEAVAAALATPPAGGGPARLVIHGTDDREVPLAQAEAQCTGVRKAGGDCALLPVEGASHRPENWWPSQWGYKERMIAWLREKAGDPGSHTPYETRLRKRIVYDAARGLALDAWTPPGSGPFPVVIVVHGGGWEAGDRVTYVTPLLGVLSRAGIAWVSIDYRLTPAVRHPEQLQDLRTAIAWVKREGPSLRLDPGRVALLGESASGQMVAQVATEEASFAGVVSFYGVYDFAPMVSDASPRSLVARLFGKSALDDEARALMRKYSPLHGVHGKMPPILLIHGTNERLWEQGVAMAAALDKAGVAHELLRLEGAPHGVENWEGHPEWAHYKARLVAWLQDRFAAKPVTIGAVPHDVRHADGTAEGLPGLDVLELRRVDAAVYARTAAGAARWDGSRWQPAPWPAGEPAAAPPGVSPVRSARAKDGRIAIAAREGLYLSTSGRWSRLLPDDGRRSWALADVRAVAFDAGDRLWFAAPQGIGRFDGRWTLWAADEGLPYDDITAMAAAPDGRIWLATRRGAIRFDGHTWEYRQGRRWLPDDEVRDVVVDDAGQAFFATPRGVGRLARVALTLAEKARRFEAEIDRLHRRTPFGFVDSVRLPAPGDTRTGQQHDSDNDGLWTSMHGAAQAFAFGATRDPVHAHKARAAFDAMRFLRLVTQGGPNGAPPGFVARTILPGDGPDPNRHDSPEMDAKRRERDALWKTIVPRWPKSADGAWYWKSDTSSDELDGHYFFYAVYYDLVADTDAERARVREHVAAITDHLMANGFRLIDHDGRPTRWANFAPESLNHDPNWVEERGLNSGSILSYLRVAEHITGDARYAAAARGLIDRHAYAMNTLIAKSFAGVGAGNQSDDEMAFMNLWCLLRYERDERLRNIFAFAFYQRWLVEQPEHNPLFHALYASSVKDMTWRTPFETVPLDPAPSWRLELVDALRRYPLDRVNWQHENGHRRDVVPLPGPVDSAGRGMRRDGRALPLDERFVDKWNHDPWRLASGGDGRLLADGTSFLLPYYLARWAGFLAEE